MDGVPPTMAWPAMLVNEIEGMQANGGTAGGTISAMEARLLHDRAAAHAEIKVSAPGRRAM